MGYTGRTAPSHSVKTDRLHVKRLRTFNERVCGEERWSRRFRAKRFGITSWDGHKKMSTHFETVLHREATARHTENALTSGAPLRLKLTLSENTNDATTFQPPPLEFSHKPISVEHQKLEMFNLLHCVLCYCNPRP